jgi:hypothetical protein
MIWGSGIMLWTLTQVALQIKKGGNFLVSLPFWFIDLKVI